MKKISILGSTGSIGTQTLEVAREIGVKVVALTTNTNIDLIERQALEFLPELIVVFDAAQADVLKNRLTGFKIMSGMKGLIAAAVIDSADMIITAVVGMIGLLPTIEAIKKGKDIGLANKETLVCAGEIVMRLAREKNVNILPIDSEHSAIWQCLDNNNNNNKIKKIILTASGGPFLGRKDLSGITKAQALRHPNWSMGQKITIDSATLMNKGLEYIEAMWLYDTKDIEVLVHKESIIHSMVEFYDNSVIAQLSSPDMKLPIQYAITYPDRLECDIKRLDLSKISSLTFEKPDVDTFKCLKLAVNTVKTLGNSGAVLNAANEAAVDLFLSDKIGFCDIAYLIEIALEKVPYIKDINIENILESDKLAREIVYSSIKE